eukprot:gene6325-8057_t
MAHVFAMHAKPAFTAESAVLGDRELRCFQHLGKGSAPVVLE